MIQLSNIIIAGASLTGKTTYAHSIINDSKPIEIKTGGTPIYELLANLSTSFVQTGADDHDMTLIIDDLNYGSYGTAQLTQIIREVNHIVNRVNENRDQPLISTIIWIGTRQTLIKLVTDELTYQLMDPNTDVHTIKTECVNKINAESLEDYFANPKQPFNVYTIDVN